MTLIEQTSQLVEGSEEISQQVGNFVAVQTVNVLNSGQRILDWYLTQAQNNQTLAQLTKLTQEVSLSLSAPSGESNFDLYKFMFFLGAGIGGGLAISRAIIENGYGYPPDPEGRDDRPLIVCVCTLGGGIAGAIFGLR